MDKRQKQKMVDRARLELAPPRCERGDLPGDLPAQWLREQVSNLRSPRSERGALPAWPSRNEDDARSASRTFGATIIQVMVNP